MGLGRIFVVYFVFIASLVEVSESIGGPGRAVCDGGILRIISFNRLFYAATESPICDIWLFVIAKQIFRRLRKGNLLNGVFPKFYKLDRPDRVWSTFTFGSIYA